MAGSNGLIVYHFLGMVTCVAMVYLTVSGPLGLPVPRRGRSPPAAQAEVQWGFVRREGAQLWAAGAPVYVNGWNSYWLMDQAVEPATRPRVAAMLRAAAAMGLAVCRTWAFNDGDGDGDRHALQIAPGRFDDRVFQALDYVIVEARRHGIRLLLSLVNNLDAYGGKTQYVRWAWNEGARLNTSGDSFFTDPSVRRYFKFYLRALLTRKNHLNGLLYKDDPTIFAWELINEPRCMSDPSGDALQNWIEEMARYVKSIDSNHLLTVGSEGFYSSDSPHERMQVNPGDWFGSLGTDFIRNSRVPEIDFASVHLYPDSWLQDATLDEKLRFVSKWLSSHIEDGDQELQKPVLLTEFGLSHMTLGFKDSHRDLFYSFIYDTIYRSARRNGSGSGAFIWQLGVEGMELFHDEFMIVPTERLSLHRLMQNQSCRLAALRNSYGSTRGMWRHICE